ncbi:similar to Saccharomyces cerevisiae YGL021W ALK1 Protein kinase [Maudiozyma saulgeensis]|uniref:non-specific serine/threonine protein kinase n=1 Tax=Maudiozyma saulgeensis TaxID=1789683 RepID=A0A1X7R5P3_9SACH|nr:similar to Saccharomyces cerevisiae YGL021W ALK1 Protein kinase [Kazachstania saulgeensis]
MTTEMENSFDEYAMDDHKFIALVVSSSDEDDIDETESYGSSIIAHKIISNQTTSQVGTTAVRMTTSHHSTETPQRKISSVSNITRKSSERKSNGEQKKRWSLISNHSHSSSSKKRWSMLSSFTMDTNTKDSITSGSKRVISTSSASQSSVNEHLERERDSGASSNHKDSRSSSIKRSSTGASLRQLFNKISISDKEVGIDNNKENIHILPHNKNMDSNIKNQKTIIPSTHNRPSTTSSTSSSHFRVPLKPLNVQTPTHQQQQQQHNIQLRNRRSMQPVSNRHSFQSASIYSHNTINPTGNNNDNNNINNNDNGNNNLSNSTPGKWKFWKKSTNEISKSISTHSLNINKATPHNLNHNRNNSSAISIISNSSTIGNGHGNTNNSIRNRTSFTDFHKTFFSSDSATVNNGNSSNIGSTSERRQSINNKRSSSSLSISLKHKTSYSSLKKFKSRRKSNTTNDDGSSLISVGSGGNSMNRTTSNNGISLPIPDEVSREKIRAKLRNSTSLLSLNAATPVNRKQFDETILNQVLNLTTIKYVLTDIDLKQADNSNLEILSSTNSLKLTAKVWRMISTRDPTETVICKKLSLNSSEKTMSLNELMILKLTNGTPGLPVLLQSYVHKSSSPTQEEKLTLYLFFKDHGTSLEATSIHSWSQCLNIFWQCVSILYVTETKFKFEHRNLTLDHILIDSSGNVTLCDMETCRAESVNSPNPQTFYKRLDHPIFYQNKKEYAFDMYQNMRQYFNGESTWINFEPKTNLLWLRYLVILLLKNNSNGKFMGPGRDQLNKIASILEYSTMCNSRRNHLFKRKENEIKSTGDLLRYK